MAGYGGTTNAVYGDYADPDDWGPAAPAPGASAVAWCGSVATTLSLDGQILADGAFGHQPRRRRVRRRRLRGGYHTAGYRSHPSRGGNTATHGAGGGGGGRIAVYAADSPASIPSHITAPAASRLAVSTAGRDRSTFATPTSRHGTLIIDASGGRQRLDPLGLPGQDTASIPDALLIRGRPKLALSTPA